MGSRAGGKIGVLRRSYLRGGFLLRVLADGF